MDLGIAGKRAVVCAASKGLGRGCAMALAEAGAHLVINARGAEALEDTAEAIRAAHGVDVTAVAADITTEEGRAKVLDAAGDTDILVNNAGGPPPGMWQDWDREDFIKALDGNMLAPIAMIQALVPGMMDQGWGRVVNITSQSVRAPIGVLGLSNSARTGLTGYVAGQRGRLGVIHVFRLHHNPYLTTGLNRKYPLYTAKAGGGLFQVLKPLNIEFQGLFASPRPGCANRIGASHQERLDSLVLVVVMLENPSVGAIVDTMLLSDLRAYFSMGPGDFMG